MKVVILVIILSISSLFGQGTQSQPNIIDVSKPTLTITYESLFENRNDPDAGLKEGSVEYLKALSESNRFNIILYSNNYNQRSIYQAYVAELNKEVPDELASNSLIIHEDNSTNSSYKNDIRIVQNNYNLLHMDGFGSETPRDAFINLVEYAMNETDSVISSWSNDDPIPDELRDVVFLLGAYALKDDFTLDNIDISFDYATNPISCKVQGQVISINICIDYNSTEYRWVDQAARQCGIFEVGKDKLIKLDSAILCEPEYIQQYENHLNETVIKTCQESLGCLDKFIGETPAQLVSDYQDILLNARIAEERIKVRDSESYDYTSELSKMSDDITDFFNSCENQYNDIWLEQYFAANSENENHYNETLDSIKSSLANALSPIMESSDIDRIRDSFVNEYNTCLKQTIENKRSIIRQKISEQEYFYENCLHDSLSTQLSNYLLSFGDDDFTDYMIRRLSGICPLGDVLSESNLSYFGRYGNEQSYALSRFDLPFDSARCFEAISKESEGFEHIARLQEYRSNANNLTQLLNVDASNIETQARELLSECLEEGESENCARDSVIDGQLRLMFNYIGNSGTSDDEVEYQRNEANRRAFVELASESAEVMACVGEDNINQSQFNTCIDAAKEFMDREDGLFFNSEYMQAARALRDDLELITKELSRDISVFHWGTEEMTGHDDDEPAPLRSMRTYGYVYARESMFHTGRLLDSFVPDAGAVMAGRGLYAAGDPNSTSNYGNTLIEIRLSEGSSFLDLRESGSGGEIVISEDTYNKLIEAGCRMDERFDQDEHIDSEGNREDIPSNYIYRLSDGSVAVRKTVFEKFGRCHDIFSEVVGSLGVNFLAYNYSSNLPPFCDENLSSTAAFVMIDTQIRGQTRTYNLAQIEEAIKAYEEDGTEIPEDIRRVIQLNQGAFEERNVAIPTLDDSSESVEHWKNRLFLCNQLNEEDQISERIRR